MKITNGQKAFIIGLIGVAFAVLAIFKIAKPNVDTTTAIKADNQTLQARLSELQVKQSNRDQYLAETEEYEEKFQEKLDSFPADLNQEVTIMFLQGIKDTNDFTISSLGLGSKEQFYTLGQGGGDASLDVTADTTATDTTDTTDTTTDTATTDATAVDTAAADTTTTDVATTDTTTDISGYECYRAAFPISYEGSYQSLKDVIAYIDNYQDRMAVTSLDVTYDTEADRYSGSIQMYCYSVESEDRPQSAMEKDDVEIGVSNIFLGDGVTSSSSDSSMTKYDENDGEAIVTSYDFYAFLNPSTSDVSAKLVGKNGSDASQITNSDNTVSTLSFEFYEKDGKNYCKYTLDNSTSYEAEVTSAEDIKVLLKSSARKDDDDTAGVRVTINNTTSLPVYVKVTGDDTSSPRVNIASKSGSVKVYK